MNRSAERNARRWIVFVAAVVAAGACVAVAAAAVIQSQVVAEGTGLKYRFEKRVADAGGFDSGWHIHPGISIIQVQDGTLQVYDASCRTTTVTAGGTAIEAPWEPIRVVSRGRLTWTTTLLVEGGSPLAVPLSAYTPQRPNPCPSIP